MLEISLINNESINNDFGVVFRDILNKYRILIPIGPPLGYKKIKVKLDKEKGPMCVTNYLPYHYLILLNLTIESRYYNQATYQFAHELCHIYCNPYVSNRFIESICMMSSWYFLDYLHAKWLKNPPYPNWKSYAQRFIDYKNREIEKIDLNLDEYSDVRNILKLIENKNYSSDNERNLQRIAAETLLQIFQKSKKSWLLLPELRRLPNFKYLDPVSHSQIDWDKFSETIRDNNLKDVFKEIMEIIR